jgi:hypothetical protein
MVKFELLEKTKQLYVLLVLTKCNSITIRFDLWILKGVHDVLTFVIDFLRVDWKPKHMITIGLFEVVEISWQVLVINLIELLNHGLKTQIVIHERWKVNLTNNYICEKWMVNECYIKIYCDLWNFGLGRNFSSELFLACL